MGLEPGRYNPWFFLTMRVFRTIPAAAGTASALTIGNFDGVHLGHREMLRRLRRAATARGLPALVLTFEPHPREFFAPDRAPARITALRDKLLLLAGAGADAVCVCRFDYRLAQLGAAEFIDRILVAGLGARWIIVGDDFRFGARRAGGLAELRAAGARHGYEVESLPTQAVAGSRVSSTAVREALSRGELGQAARLLGRPYAISGRVVHGDRLGRQLGFPTANIRLPAGRAPLGGIFVVEVHGVDAVPLPGVASLGVRPTIRGAGELRFEVHLLDCERDLYGRHLRVEFLDKLRDEERYADLETLKRQIALDCERARAHFERRRAAAAR
jgi:riboflavin kinase/FMN adenylyltransferase